MLIMFINKNRSHMTRKIHLTLLALILALTTWPQLGMIARGAPPATTAAAAGSRIKVLVVGSGDKLHAMEEAAALSLELPVREPTKEQELAMQQANQTSSLGYHQASLASLTLHQQQRYGSSAVDHTTTAAAASQQRVPRQPDPWSELYLPRLKPTWLNVSSRFKITGLTIEEIAEFVPAEYLLRPAFDSPILLKTKLGIMEGVRSIKFNKQLYTFLSVPYAKAPIGELRFKAPQPIDKWDGIYQATKWPPFCAQASMTLASKSSPVHILSHIMSEDCLYMNIWTPSLKLNKNRKRPVMVWIHGGAFQYGGISVDENDASALALLGDVVVVTLNYRLSAFGFLNANNQKNAPNNIGIQDQRAAMEWVQANIKQFGGDPQQVTLFGESAGGHSVGLHMISPASQPLFKRAILQSGVPVSFLRSYDSNPDNKDASHLEGIGTIMMAKRLGCYTSSDSTMTTIGNASEPEETTTTVTVDTVTSNEPEEEENGPILDDITLECMRDKSSLEILKAMGKPGSSGFFPTGNDPKGVFTNGPIMDSFNPDNLKVGPQKDYLIGTNLDEGTFMLHYGMPSLFPARVPPTVTSVAELKSAITSMVDRTNQEAALARNNSDIQSASGSNNSGAQAHLYKPLLRLSNSMLENFLTKSRMVSPDNTSTPTNLNAEFGRNIGSLITDIIFLCPARSLARTLSESGRNVYFYLYTHRSSQSQYHDWLGVTHHDEVEFVFGRPLRLADRYTGKDVEMSQRMIKTWSHFAYTGQMLDQLGLKWPKYGEEDNTYMSLAAEHAATGERYHDKMCNIYDTVISVHLQDG